VRIQVGEEEDVGVAAEGVEDGELQVAGGGAHQRRCRRRCR
jgi:hypothetical protein